MPGVSEIVAELIIGAAVGCFIGLTGAGGGVLLVPALMLVLGFSATTAVGTATLYAFLTRSHAAFEHWRLRTIHWPTCRRVLMTAVPVDVATCLTVLYLRRSYTSQVEMTQTWLIVAVMIGAIVLMLRSMQPGAKDAPVTSAPVPPSRALAVGAGIGFILATTSAGAVMLLPSLMLFIRLSARQSAGTCVFVMLMLTPVTAVLYGKGGALSVSAAIIMWLGALPGVYLGSRLAARVPDQVLRRVVIVVVLLAAVMMVVKATL